MSEERKPRETGAIREAAEQVQVPTRRPRATSEQLVKRREVHPYRVEFVADMMRKLEFRMGVTHKLLAEAWDLPEGYVAKLCVEAGRIVRAELAGDQDFILSKIGAALNWVIDDAIASGDRHAIIKACQVYATVTGASAPQKVEIGQDLSSLSPEQLAARKAELLARLSKPVPNPAPLEITVGPKDDE